jgi:hypothetical protein
MLPEGFPMRQFVDQLFRSQGLRPRVQLEIDRVEALLATVALSGTPTVLPAVVLDRAPGSSPPLRSVALAGAADAPVALGVVWSRTREIEAATQHFIAIARSLLSA